MMDLSSKGKEAPMKIRISVSEDKYDAVKDYLAGHGIRADSLDKKKAAELIPAVPEDVAQVLKLRLQLAKSSVSKY